MENMDDILQKAQVLVEALPYIQRFNRKIIVVKYGGSAMVDEELKKSVIQDEMLVLCPEISRAEMELQVKELEKHLEKLEIAVAMGYSWSIHPHIRELITETDAHGNVKTTTIVSANHFEEEYSFTSGNRYKKTTIINGNDISERIEKLNG